MASTLRVQVEQPTRDKKWVAVAVDWPGFERGAKDEAGAIEKLQAYVPRYLPVAKRARLGAELERQTQLEVVERYRGSGSTDFWGISFAPSSIDRLPMDPEVFERQRPAPAGRMGRVRRGGGPRVGGASTGPAGRWTGPGPHRRHVLSKRARTSRSASRCRPSSRTYCAGRLGGPP